MLFYFIFSPLFPQYIAWYGIARRTLPGLAQRSSLTGLVWHSTGPGLARQGRCLLRHSTVRCSVGHSGGPGLVWHHVTRGLGWHSTVRCQVWHSTVSGLVWHRITCGLVWLGTVYMAWSGPAQYSAQHSICMAWSGTAQYSAWLTQHSIWPGLARPAWHISAAAGAGGKGCHGMLAHGASRGAAKWLCLRSHACLLQTSAVSAGQPGPCEGMPLGPAIPIGLVRPHTQVGPKAGHRV